MYIPIMKTRKEEFSVSKNLNNYFSDDIIPLFEILNEEYEVKYEIDSNGNYLMEKKAGRKKKSRIKKEVTNDDIITLDKINNIVNGAKVFIDYFRFDIKKYGNKFDVSKVMLAYRLNNNSEEYIKKLLEVSRYENMTPVLSLKNAHSFSNSKVIEIISKLQELNSSIALRIEDALYDTLKSIVEKYLRESDYFLYDINEQDFESKFIELSELEVCKTKAKKIVLNSPRDPKITNKDYENECVTMLINNSAVTGYKDYNLDGFGDYGGLKDQLPTNGGSNGKGAALALLYNYNDNSFYSFCNSDTSLGLKGYREVVDSILNFENILNPNNDCIAYSKIKLMREREKYGSWCTWNNIALTRYIQQIHMILNK